MLSVPQSAISTKRQKPLRALASVLLGAGMTVLLACLVILIIWLLRLSHASGSALSQLLVLLTTLLHTPAFLIAFVVALIVFSLLFWLLARPRAIAAYLREAAGAQELYHRRYISLAHAVPAQPQNSSANPVQPAPVADLLLPDTFWLLSGEPGMGKTMALREYLYQSAQDRRGKRRERIPLYVPLPHYALYLKAHLQT